MELPPRLREAIDQAIAGVSLASLAAAFNELSLRYRRSIRDGRPHLDRAEAARAYVAARMPACFAAVAASLLATAKSRPDFAPVTHLDAGAGPGTAVWAAMTVWPDLADALLVEASPAILALGERLAASIDVPRTAWRTGDVTKGLTDCEPRDLVTFAYVLGEIEPARRGAVIDRLWQLTRDVLVIVEPGTPAGSERMLVARHQLLAAGAFPIAPCPHAADCPLTPPDWCHFAQRIPRSRIHRDMKNGALAFEDEKFIYLACSRVRNTNAGARVIAHPRAASGRVTLKLCGPDGTTHHQTITRRDGQAFKAARRARWGDLLEP
jgi:ribosomal protein RSM22 (predicted rRNA methylase)